ncbi:hypothetical protein HY374_02690 [Candidatus Berkelbacteria bacterium]|nr:hypothetical protein [Candidatus Berkelbacteria bacterium]
MQVVRLGNARRVLDALTRELPATTNDVVEFMIRAGGATAALLYPRVPWESPKVESAIDALTSSGRAAQLLKTCVRGIPAARRSVRLSANGAVSVFSAIDLEPARIEALGRAFLSDEVSGNLATFFVELDTHACGVAIEVAHDGSVRPRWYTMLDSRSLPRALNAAREVFRLAPQGLDHVASVAESITACSSRPLVCNVAGMSHGAALKIEFPDVPLEQAIPLWTAVGDFDALNEVMAMSSELGVETCSYVGVRAFTTPEVEVSLYLDARDWLPTRSREAP